MITPQVPTNVSNTPEYIRQVAATLNQSIRNGNTLRLREIAASGPASTGDGVLMVNAASGPVTVALPTPAEMNQRFMIVFKKDSSGNAVTISGSINGAASKVLSAQYDKAWLYSDGSAYFEL